MVRDSDFGCLRALTSLYPFRVPGLVRAHLREVIEPSTLTGQSNRSQPAETTSFTLDRINTTIVRQTLLVRSVTSWERGSPQKVVQGLGVGDLGEAGGGGDPVRSRALSVPNDEVRVAGLHGSGEDVFVAVLGQVTAQAGQALGAASAAGGVLAGQARGTGQRATPGRGSVERVTGGSGWGDRMRH